MKPFINFKLKAVLPNLMLTLMNFFVNSYFLSCIFFCFSSNDVWCFNLYSHSWIKQAVSGVKPQSRYGQSQIALDDDHLLILGNRTYNII